MNSKKQGLFQTDDGKNLIVTFILVSSLFLLWGICNGMIDTMDKHFQEELGLSKSQSAWVQFAHYLGYFLMSMPAGLLASRFGYKWGIIAGLLMVSAGGFWFLPATHINSLAHAGVVSHTTAFIGYLAGVWAIAAGLTFLETVANPYTTVLGPKQYAATRINLAQSCNGIGWMCGPIIGGVFFYSKDAAGHSTGNETLYIPYLVVAVVVLVLAVVFYFAYIPDIKTEDEYHLDDKDATVEAKTAEREVNRVLVYILLWLNSAVLVGVFAIIFSLILSALDYSQNMVWIATGLLLAMAAAALIPIAKKISHHSIWTHPHFSSATLAQFFYVAAQAGIFSFFINYMTSELPAIPTSVTSNLLKSWFESGANGVISLSDKGAANLASVGFLCFLIGRFVGSGLLKKFSAHKILGLYAVINVFTCLLIFLKLGWFSVVCVFLNYFFMSIMFPTIFALGIFGLGVRAKKASAYIVMAIMGGAILPKLMGYVADKSNMSHGFIVPLFCFAIIALYGFAWPKLSGAEGMHDVKTTGGH